MNIVLTILLHLIIQYAPDRDFPGSSCAGGDCQLGAPRYGGSCCNVSSFGGKVPD